MPILRRGETLIYFVHIPKTGGTSIEHYLRQKGELVFCHPKRPDGLLATPQHLHAAILDTMFPESFFQHSFAVVRDPLNRLISEYRWRGTMPKRLIAKGGVFHVPRWHKKRRLLSFDAWVPRVLDVYRDDPFVNDNHLRPQVEFLRPNDKVFLFEHGLEKVYDWLDQVLQSPTGPRSIHEKRSRGDLPEISDATRALVQDFYREDYDRLASLKARAY